MAFLLLWAVMSQVAFVDLGHCLQMEVPQQLQLQQPEDGRTAPFRQEMVNMGDLQYTADLSIGGQRVQGIFDTGSFELVTFSMGCSSCFKARAYDSRHSATYMKGQLKEEQAYGSGSCETEDAYETVSVGSFVAPKQPFWQATSCKMPLLKEAAFNAIVGIGPPGQPEFTANATLTRVKEMIAEAEASGKKPSEELLKAKTTVEEKLASAKTKRSMLENFGVSVFSVCLGRKAASPGYLIWNDRVPTQGTAMVAHVVGSIMWGVKLDRFALHDEKKDKLHTYDCEDGCGAVVDSGTSLIGVPSSVYMKVFSSLGLKMLNCNDLSKFPDLVLTVGGNELYLPPEAYIGRMYGKVPHEVKKFFPLRQQANLTEGTERPIDDLMHKVVEGLDAARGGAVCQLLLMDLGSQKTQFGPMYILGMPFFREFYTTFDQGTGRGDRNIHLSPADNECRPSGPSSGSLAIERRDVGVGKKYRRQREPGTVAPRWVDASKLRVPHWLSDSAAPAEATGGDSLSL